MRRLKGRRTRILRAGILRRSSLAFGPVQGTRTTSASTAAPPRREGVEPAPSRLAELEAVTVPMLVVQGTRDRFGMPPAAPLRTIVQVAADHSLRTDLEAIGEAVRAWLLELTPAGGER